MKSSWQSFLSLCLKAQNNDELAHLFDCFLTPEEKKDIADRFLIIKSLLEGQMTQREMSDKLHVSIAKITRGSNALKVMNPKIKDFLEKNT